MHTRPLGLRDRAPRSWREAGREGGRREGGGREGEGEGGREGEREGRREGGQWSSDGIYKIHGKKMSLNQHYQS